MKSIIITAALCIFIVSGCGPKATAKGFQARLDAYRGQHIDNLAAAWGPPQGDYTYKDGTKEYSFLRSRYVERSQPVIGLGLGGVFGRHFGLGLGGYAGFPVGGGEITRYTCDTRVKTDRKGFITGYTYQGNDCRAPEDARPASGE